jgi:hypothetical protein
VHILLLVSDPWVITEETQSGANDNCLLKMLAGKSVKCNHCFKLKHVSEKEIEQKELSRFQYFLDL